MTTSSSGEAVDLATNLQKIGFPEFTCKLVTDVFDAMISANLRQISAYAELFSDVSKGLSTFINETKDDINGSDVLELLIKILPDKSGNTKVLTEGATKNLSEEDAKKLNDELTVKDANDNAIAKIDPPLDSIKDTYGGARERIMEAAAKRLAANKYETLEKMLRLGFMRLVVESGKIETRLSFSTYGNDYKSNYTSDCKTTTTRDTHRPSFINRLFWTAQYSNKQEINVEHASSSSSSSLGSRTDIFGQVVINFKTDYMPLDK